jgi:hypothetical protein
MGDVDGDGSADRVFLVQRRSAPDECNTFLVAETARGTIVARLRPLFVWNADIPVPRLLALAEIDRKSGAEVVIDVWDGASSMNVAVFTVRNESLRRMSIRAPRSDDVFENFSSAGAGKGNVDCVGGQRSGVVVDTTTGMLQKRTATVVRRFYVVVGSDFVPEPTKTTRERVPVRQLDGRYPELNAVDDPGVFPSCGTVRVR